MGNATKTLVMMLAFAWLMTHDGCAHPMGNVLALVVFVAAGTSLLLPQGRRLGRTEPESTGELKDLPAITFPSHSRRAA